MSVTTTTQGAVAHPAHFDPFANEAALAGVKTGEFLKFNGNDGTFLYGPKDDQKELSHGAQVAIRLHEYRRGWFCWKESEVVDRVMVGIMEGVPPTDANYLEDHGPYKKYDDGSEDGWMKTGEITLFDINGGAYAFTFGGDTKCNAFARLCGEFGKQWKLHPDEVPVVEIGARKFEVKGQRKGTFKYAPTYTIVGWMKEQEFVELQATSAASAAAQTNTSSADSEDASNYAAQAPVETVQSKQATATPETTTPPADGASAAPESRRSKRFGTAG